MDPLTALGLAANIAQFVSVGHKLVVLAKEIRSSATGTPKEVNQLSGIVVEIRRKVESQTPLAISKVSEEDNNVLCSVAQGCLDVAETLIETLSKLEPKHRTSGIGSLESAVIAVKFLWKKDGISELKNRLFELERRYNSWWEAEQSLERHSSISAKLQDLSVRQSRLKVQTSNQLASLSLDLGRSFHDLKNLARRCEELSQANSEKLKDELQTLKDQVTSSHHLRLLETKDMLERLAEEMRNVERHEIMMRSLSFSSIKSRQGTIPDAQLGTLQWLFACEKPNFSQWLEQGQGVFWVDGLPGSGKSTLMKFAASHLQTHRLLQSWAKPSKLVTAAHYFWIAGTEMQKSNQGLLQNLLHQLFRSSPYLADALCPNRPPANNWDVDELQAAFLALGRQAGLGTKFCFFIDGLDEFDGPPEDIIQIVNGLASSPHIKLCVSSRGWTAFRAEWGASEYTLKVDKFTKDDMDTYIRALVGADERFGRSTKTDERYDRLIPSIAERAEGVWLWVYLVVRDLLRDMRDNEPYEHLLVRLNSYPKELEDYYEDILRRIDKIHQTESAQIFLLRLAQKQGLPLLSLAYLSIPGDCNLAMKAYNAPHCPATSDEMDALYNEWNPRLQNRCRDLLKITLSDDSDVEPTRKYVIDFLHRTARDFVGDRHSKMQGRAPTGFDASLFSAYFALIRLKRFGLPVEQGKNLLLLSWDVSDMFATVREHKAKVHQASDPIGLRLIDELDLMLSGILDGLMLGSVRQGVLLELATHYSVYSYVEHKLGHDSARKKSFIALLLDIALRNGQGLKHTAGWTNWHYSHLFNSIDSRMVATLLTLGADPNEPIEDGDYRAPALSP